MHRAPILARLIRQPFCGAVVLSMLTGCSDPAKPGDSLYSASRLRSAIFIARTAEPSVYMEALYSGVITIDSAGCLRMEGLDRHTPIWPTGYRLDIASGLGVVRSADGSIIGAIGAQFRFGGGEVQTLEWVSLSPTDRERATSSCPGRYWIVSGP